MSPHPRRQKGGGWPYPQVCVFSSLTSDSGRKARNVKAGTHNMIKFKRLQRCLKLPLWQAVGLLEALWQLTAKDTPRGDIGRFSDEDIAAWLEYDGNALELTEALEESGWLDYSEEHRLVVHDWHMHAPNYVKGNVSRHLGGFVSEAPQGSLTPTSPGEPGASVPPSLVKPSQVKPGNTMSGSEEPDDVPETEKAEKPKPYSTDFEDFWQAFPSGRKTKKLKAWFAWTGAIRRVDDPTHLIQRAKDYARSEAGRGEYVQMPSSWLDGGCWEDEDAVWNGNGSPPPVGPAKRDPELARNMLRTRIVKEAADRGLNWDDAQIDEAVEKQMALGQT